MKKLTALLAVSLSLTTTSTLAAPQLLSNYQQILHALKHGHNVRGIVTLDNCKVTDARTTDGHEEFKGDFIGTDFNNFSNTHWTVDRKAKNGVVTSTTQIAKHENYNYRTQTMKAFEDNTVEYTWAIGSSKNGDLLKSWTWTCQLGTAKDKDTAGALFYMTN